MLGEISKMKDKSLDWEKRYKTLLEHANDGVIMINKMGKVVEFNRKAEKILGYKENEIIGSSVEILAPPEQLEIQRRGFKRVIKEGRPYSPRGIRENEWVRKDGTRVLLEISMFIMEAEEEELLMGAFFRDISARKQVEEALQREKEFSKMIIETADVLIVTLDLEGKITLFNKKAEEVTGYTRSEVMGKDFIKVLIQERYKADFAKMFKDILENKAVSPHDLIVLTKNGEERIIFSRGSPLRNNEGKIIGLLGIGGDVTEMRKMEEKLIQSEKLRALGELSGGVAHDFNNMLTAILGRVELLKMNLESFSGKERRKISPLLKQSLEVIEKAASDGAETVRRVQEFSSMRADDKDFIHLDLNEVVNDALDFTRTRWKDEAELKGIKIQIKKELSPISSIMGKASELREVLTNLINNSLDAMPQGGRIKIKTFEEDKCVFLKVEDTGIGMPVDVMKRVFDPFYTTKGPKSTGLGMSLSYSIITRHQGTISVDSQEGKGTTFTIMIPTERVKKIEEGEFKEFSKKERKANILVIEDEEDIKNLLSDILTSDGHKVTTASDGKEGIEVFKKGSFEIVFTDLGMPGMSGWEVASSIKKLCPEVIVIIITGWGIQHDKDKQKKSGVDMIVNKPFKLNHLLKLIRDALEAKDKIKSHRQ